MSGSLPGSGGQGCCGAFLRQTRPHSLHHWVSRSPDAREPRHPWGLVGKAEGGWRDPWAGAWDRWEPLQGEAGLRQRPGRGDRQGGRERLASSCPFHSTKTWVPGARTRQGRAAARGEPGARRRAQLGGEQRHPRCAPRGTRGAGGRGEGPSCPSSRPPGWRWAMGRADSRPFISRRRRCQGAAAGLLRPLPGGLSERFESF